MSDTQTNSDGHVLEEWTTPGGIRVKMLSADGWSARTGQGNHATLSTHPSKMPRKTPEPKPEGPDAAESAPTSSPGDH